MLPTIAFPHDTNGEFEKQTAIMNGLTSETKNKSSYATSKCQPSAQIAILQVITLI